MKMMQITKLGLAIMLAAIGSAAAAAGDAAAGKAAYSSCIACHGVNGEGNPALNSPALGGQMESYVARQIANFRSGKRGSDPKDTLGMQMRGMASVLQDDTAVANVAAYIATLPASKGSPYEHDVRNGENQYNAACGACHGANAEGNAALNSPRLAGLDAAYLERQYKNFANGVRGSHPDDRFGKQMQLMSTMLATDKDLADVIGFIQTQ